VIAGELQRARQRTDDLLARLSDQQMGERARDRGAGVEELGSIVPLAAASGCASR
jgi:hypothetical protein